DDRSEGCGSDALTLRHGDGELGAWAAVLAEHRCQTRGIPRIARHASAIPRQVLHLPESHDGSDVRGEHLAQVARVVAVVAFEGVDAPFQQPTQHRHSLEIGTVDRTGQSAIAAGANTEASSAST